MRQFYLLHVAKPPVPSLRHAEPGVRSSPVAEHRSAMHGISLERKSTSAVSHGVFITLSSRLINLPRSSPQI